MSKRIEQKKEQITKLEDRIKEDNERLKRYKEELKQLEANEVLTLLQANNLSLEDVSQWVRSQDIPKEQEGNHERLS
ncbi:hypothetical protein LVO94_002211 [Enterococcus faecalis]|nr:hypothetical protein [Enterococcus faecalis]